MKSVLKEKYRYIAFRIISDRKYDMKELETSLRKELIRLVGEMDYSIVLPKLIFYDADGREGIIKVLRLGLEKTKAALSLINSFDGNKTHVMPVFVSGTIKGAKSGMSKR